MKMHRVLLFFTFLFVVSVSTLISSASASGLNPPDEVDESELEEVTRPIRASAGNVAINGPPRKRGGRARGRKNGDGVVLKRRLPSTVTIRPTRAPLFEASPPDPFLEHGAVGPTAAEHYGHSHSPPTPDPYYSPSKYERERKRHRIKLASERPHNNFDQGSNIGSSEYQKPGKNYAFAYAVGDEAEDFSHKQAKDGSVTVGEYRITLPDGRTQVVRYTAGAKSGYKADVTYERGEHPNGFVTSAGSLGHHQNGQYHQSVQPTHHLAATPSPSFQNTRVYKSRPLKNVALHSNEDVEYSPGSGDEPEFHPTPKIRSKGAVSKIPHGPTPTAAYLNGINSTPSTPRPNSIYDKISPYRGGAQAPVTYSGSVELASLHEQSPRAGPVRAKKQHKLPKFTSTAASFHDSPSPTPFEVITSSLLPTKKYKEPAGAYYSTGHQPQANHVNEYVRPQKHVQYLQETPINHQHQHHTPLIAKPIKTTVHHTVPLGGPVSYSPLVALPKKKTKKNKHAIHHHQHHHHGAHQPLGHYLLQNPVSDRTPHVNAYPVTPTAPGVSSGIPQLPFHYYNSLHHGHQTHISASPTPVTTVTHHDTPFPLTFTSGGTPLSHNPHHVQTQTGGSGRGYLDTPPSGERPNRLGVKEVLSRLPSHDLATPKTTVHPYEVGAVDYGKSVAYGLAKPLNLDAKGFPNAHYGNGFGTTGGGGVHGLEHLDPTNSLFTSSGSLGGSHQNVGYFPNNVDDHFNFLDGLSGFDIEQANVREIRQPSNGRARKGTVRKQRRPDKRQGVPAASDEDETPKPSPTPSRPRSQKSTSSPRPKPTHSTTQRSRGRRRRTKTPDSTEGRRSRPRGRNSSSK